MESRLVPALVEYHANINDLTYRNVGRNRCSRHENGSVVEVKNLVLTTSAVSGGEWEICSKSTFVSDWTCVNDSSF